MLLTSTLLLSPLPVLLLSYEPAITREADCGHNAPQICQPQSAHYPTKEHSYPFLISVASNLRGSQFEAQINLKEPIRSVQNLSSVRIAQKSNLKTKQEKTPETPVVEQPQSPDDRVENVIHYLRIVSVGKPESETKELQYFTALLLKDGRVFENEERAPGIFDPTQRPPGTAGTGHWERDGEAYALTFTDGTPGTAVSTAAKTSPAPTSMILTGEFEVASSGDTKVFAPRISFFKDGSLILRKDEKTSNSGHYKINSRSIEIEDGMGTSTALLFGVHEPIENPPLLIIGNKLYQKVENN